MEAVAFLRRWRFFARVFYKLKSHFTVIPLGWRVTSQETNTHEI